MIKNLTEKEIKSIMEIIIKCLKGETNQLCEELRDLKFKTKKSRGISLIATSIFDSMDKKITKEKFEKELTKI